ncbi:MAG TPA: O-antigen ligase family protein [Terriglobales bacterium]|nr:O-antigen ligase family protein [Terriglobales bacterium]
MHALLAAPSFVYFAALTIMLFRPPDLQFYHLDRIAFLVLILAVALYLLVAQQQLYFIGRVTWPMLGLSLLAFFSLLNEPYEPQDWSTFAAKWVVPFALYQISMRIFDHPAALRRFEIFSLVVLGYLCVIAILFLFDAQAFIFPGYIVDQNLGIHADRARGPFLQAVANGMTINMLALIALDAFRRRRLHGALAMFLFCAVPIAVLATKTRAVWLGFAGSVVLLAFSSNKRVRYACLGLIVAAAIAVGTAIAFENPSNSIAERFEEQSPVEFRMAMYRAGWEMFLEKPLFGWGMRDMQAELASRIDDFHQEEFFLHNTYLEILVQHGLLGIGLYAWIVIDLLRLGQHAGRTTLHGQFLDRRFRAIWSVFVLVYLLNASFVVMNYQFVNGLLFTVAGMLAAQNRRARLQPMLLQSND